MIEASTTTAIVTSIVASGVGIITILGLMIGFMVRSMNIQFTHTNTRIDDTRIELSKRIDDTRIELNKRIDDTRIDLGKRTDETNNRLQRVETRVDEIGRDIGELRDRTGKLEGTLSTFIQNQGKVEAA